MSHEMEVYGQLMNRAKAIGIDVESYGPIIDFGISDREPSLLD